MRRHVARTTAVIFFAAAVTGLAAPASSAAALGYALSCELAAQVVVQEQPAKVACLATFDDKPVADVVVQGELIASSRPDIVSEPPADLEAISDAEGKVELTYTASSEGDDTFCAWLDTDKDPKNINEGDPTCTADQDTAVLIVQWQPLPASAEPSKTSGGVVPPKIGESSGQTAPQTETPTPTKSKPPAQSASNPASPKPEASPGPPASAQAKDGGIPVGLIVTLITVVVIIVIIVIVVQRKKRRPDVPGGTTHLPGPDPGKSKEPHYVPLDIPPIISTIPITPKRNKDEPNGCNFDPHRWTYEGDAFAQGPTLPHTVPTRSIDIWGRPLVPIGGDFWHGPFRIGRFQGDGWAWTSRGGPNGEAGTGSMLSPELRLNRRYLHFLLGGSRVPDVAYGVATVEAQLLILFTPESGAAITGHPTAVIDGRTYSIVAQTQPSGAHVMRRVVWDVRRYRGMTARVRIVDESTDRYILAGDFFCADEAPKDRPPVWGVADLHCHPMSMLAYGARLIAGYVPPEAVEDLSVLGHCEYLHGPGGGGIYAAAGYIAGLLPEGTGVLGHLTGGFPEFDGWPKFQNLIHNQMHPVFIRRAYEGGLRIMCALAVNSEMMAAQVGGDQGGRTEWRDDISVRWQIDYWKDIVRACGEWMEIADTPQHAREIILRNKLAVVLGVEVDAALGIWRKRQDLPMDTVAARASIRARIEELHTMGVRQINPIHVTNNAFGGTAVYQDEFNAANRFARGDYYAISGQSDVDFRLSEHEGDQGFVLRHDPFRGGAPLDPNPIDALPEQLAGVPAVGHPFFYNPPDYAQMFPGQGHVNAFGLTDVGRIGIEELMRKGMLIDVDHMSERSTNHTFDIVRSVSPPYPVLSAHSSFRELSPRKNWADQDHPGPNQRKYPHMWPHESEKSPAAMRVFREIAGMVGPITSHNESLAHAQPPRIPNDCAGSVKTWAQEYLYAVQMMGGRGVGLGTDMNSLLRQSGPRFGTQAAWGLKAEDGTDAERRRQADAQANGVRYDRSIIDYRAYRFQERDVYNIEERDIWEAIALVKCGVDPHHTDPDGPGPLNRTWAVQNKINNIAKGFFCTDWHQLEGRNDVFGGNTYAEQRAAFLVHMHGRSGPAIDPRTEIPDYHEPPATLELMPKIQAIWNKWTAMEGSNIPLQRSMAGRRDYDINIDGLAHYGMLPDFWQDLKNCLVHGAPAPTAAAAADPVASSGGLPELLPLFNSAEDFIELWERCQAFSDVAEGRTASADAGPNPRG